MEGWCLEGRRCGADHQPDLLREPEPFRYFRGLELFRWDAASLGSSAVSWYPLMAYWDRMKVGEHSCAVV